MTRKHKSDRSAGYMGIIMEEMTNGVWAVNLALLALALILLPVTFIACVVILAGWAVIAIVHRSQNSKASRSRGPTPPVGHSLGNVESPPPVPSKNLRGE